ncbi:MAG: response regulator [Planctomycetes bacterium]|nr:response regulator [Planctomycetota bacterium]
MEDLKPLVIEDDPLLILLAKTFLKQLNCQNIDVAENGEKALEKMNLNKYDIIFMDMNLPIMNGPEISKVIRSGDSPNKETPIITVSASVSDQAKKECKDAGMNDYLTKPYSKQQMEETIHKWV